MGKTMWTPSEMAMWFSCTGIWCGGMLMVRNLGHLDEFRLLFFGSPGLITAIVAPFNKDRNSTKLCGLSGFLFIVYWMVMQAYPCQCRHAWGTMMFADNRFWGNDAAIRDALMTEKDTFYTVKGMDEEEREVFGMPAKNKSMASVGHGRPDANIDRIFAEVKRMSSESEQEEQKEKQELEAEKAKLDTEDAQGAQPGMGAPGYPQRRLQQYGAPPQQTGGGGQASDRVRKWISPLTGSESLDILKLRAYCHIHMHDEKLPAIFPYRAIGLPAHYTTTLPCPYWTCVMTEARWDGKLPFFVSFALVAILNFIHYRLECQSCGAVSCVLGSGQTRIWWGWFWASFVPLWTVLLLKTTYDEELSELICNRLNELNAAVFAALSSDWNKGALAVFLATGLGSYVYWDKVRSVLGLEHHTFLPHLFSRVQDNHFERVIQVCIWRIDLSCDEDAHKGHNAVDSAPLEESNQGFFGGKVDPRSAMTPGGFLPMLGLGGWSGHDEHDMSTIRTADGRTPGLSVSFCYGSETLQYTRTVRPTWAEWRSKGSVYVQENFKLSLDWRPGVPLRVEVRDMEAPLGPTSLGDIDFDSSRLHRQLEISKKAQQQFTDVPVVQVIRMLEPPVPNTMAGRAREKMSDLKSVGFQIHQLSGGGAVWLAFSDAAAQKQEGEFSCC